MRKFIPGNLAFIISGIILIILSCTPESCFEETEAFLKASFYKDGETALLLAPDSLTIYGLNMDSTIYKKALKVQPARIPLNPSNSECSVIFKINGIVDTVQFWYSSYPHLVSKECGYTFYHHLDSAIPKFHAIKHIYIGNNTISTINVENIQIYY